MANSNVSQIAALLKNSELLSAAKSKKQESGLAFGSLLSQTTSGESQNSFASLPVSSNNQAVYERETSKPGNKDNRIPVRDNTDIRDKLPKDAEETLDAFTNQVKDVLEEKLGITEEELTQAMETLGLSFLDLADPSKLAGLVMELTGSQNPGELLLNQNFQSVLEQVGVLTEDLMMQLNLTPEELKQLMAEIGSGKQDVPKDGTASVIQPEMAETVQETADQTDSGSKLVTSDQTAKLEQSLETAEPSDTVNAADAADDMAAVQQMKTPDTETQEQQNLQKQQVVVAGQEGEQSFGSTQEEMTGQSQEQGMFRQGGLNSEAMEKPESGQTGVTYQTTVQTINHGSNVELIKTITPASIDIENLIRQVSQMTRITVVNPAETAISMQLNPENLGKIYLQVISKDGAITAQLAAQNEAVKEVLESQIVILKDNMNQQGIKVEAVEVTIASHEFEQNLDGSQNNQAKEQQEAEKNARRNINVQSLEELAGLMSEEESLAVKMMTENGNNVDFTA